MEAGGVDALLGAQTRRHNDVDIMLRTGDMSHTVELCRPGGSVSETMVLLPTSFLPIPSGLEVDVHAVAFDTNGNGLYRMASGEEWTYSRKVSAGAAS